MPLEEVVALLEELRRAEGGRGRASVVARSARALRRLTPTERRQVAVEVARRAAPELVPRLSSEVGGELTAEQVRNVLGLAEGLDEYDLEDLVATVADLAGEPQDEPWAADDARVDEVASLEEADLPEVGTVDEEPSAPAADPPAPAPAAPLAKPGGAGAPGSWDVDRAALFPPPPAEQVAAVRAPLADRIAAGETAGRRLRAFRAALDEIGGLDGADLLAVIEAVPDGWTRRRAIETLVRADLLRRDDAFALLASLGRPRDRAWTAATMILGGVASLDDIGRLLSPGDHARLRRRYHAA